jgi:hypothetical protein
VSEVTVAYVSRDAEVIKAWTDASGAVSVYVAATNAVLEAAGLGRYDVFRNSGGWSPGKFAGLAIPQGESPPKGWRMTSRYAVPDKRRKAGREIEAALGAVKHPGDPLLGLIGMPPDAETSGGFTSPAVRLLEDRTALYLGWRVDPVGRQSFLGTREQSGVVDLDRWERIPLSAYHLAIEQAEGAQAAGDGRNG